MNNITAINGDAPAASGVKVFEALKHYQKSVRLPYLGSVDIGLVASHWTNKEGQNIHSAIVIECGPVRIQTNFSADKARELAAAMAEFADELEAHQAQFALSEPQAELKTANGKM